MGKRSRPWIVTKDRLDLEAFPEHVQVALAEVAGAAREGVLALSVVLPTWEVFSQRDLLGEIALGRMLAGLSARRCRAGAEPMGEVELQGTSRSAISRRFRRATEARLAELFGRDLSGQDLLAVFIDGMHVGSHLIVVALGVDSAGRKHPLGLWEARPRTPRCAARSSAT